MIKTGYVPNASAFAMTLVLAAAPARAAPDDYRFELDKAPKAQADKDVVQVRLIRVKDGKPVTDAVVFESKADMGPAGMATMTAPVTAVPSRDGTYGFKVQPAMTGPWALHLAAKVQGETGTIRGTVTADLVK